jgi:hypothetical protein
MPANPRWLQEHPVKKRSILGALTLTFVTVGLMVGAAADGGPDRMTNRAACKRWTSGAAQDACIACVNDGNDYFRSSGECR